MYQYFNIDTLILQEIQSTSIGILKSIHKLIKVGRTDKRHMQQISQNIKSKLCIQLKFILI